MTTALPRDKDGKIIIGPLPLFGAAEETPPILRAAPVGEAPPPKRPAGDLPTPFGQQQSQAKRAEPGWRQWVAYGAAGLLLALAAWALLSQPAPRPSAIPPTAAVTAMPTGAGTITPARPTLERAVVAFAEPGGAPVGALEPGRPVLTVEERGGWRLLEAEGSGEVWVRAWEMDGTGPPTPTVAAPTAAPLPPPAPVYTQPAPAQTDWASMPVVGRAESPDGVYVCESRVSQADAEACVAALMGGE